MNMLSRRFVIAIATMLVVCAAATTWFTSHPRRHDPCVRADTLGVTSLIPGGRHLGLRTELDDDVVLWAKGQFANPLSGTDPFRYQIIRGYDTLRRSTHPVSLVDEEVEAESQRKVVLEIGETSLPIQIVEDFTHLPPRLIAYLQIHGTTPTENPLAAHLRNLGGLLREGAQPVTTIIVDGPVTQSGLPETEKAVLDWFGGAWTFFDRFCRVPAGEVG